MKKDASSPWQAFNRGVPRLCAGVIAAMGTAVVLWAASLIAARLINLIMVEPVQLRDGVTTAILSCKGAACALAFGVGLGIPD